MNTGYNFCFDQIGDLIRKIQSEEVQTKITRHNRRIKKSFLIGD